MAEYEKIDAAGIKRLTTSTFDVGDIVTKAGGSGADTLSKNEHYKITRIEYVYSSDTGWSTQTQSYENIYRQKLYVTKITSNDRWTVNPGANAGFFANNFKIVQKGTPMTSYPAAIENQKPCVAIELDVDANGEDIIKAGAEWMPFDSSLKAKAAVGKIISESIRESNIYRRFRVFTNSVVAGAKEPEIEFK